MIVQLPNGSQAEFPDDMPQAEIEAVLQKQFPAQSGKQPWETVGGEISEPKSEFSTRMPTQSEEFQKRLEGQEPWQYVGGEQTPAKSEYLTKMPNEFEAAVEEMKTGQEPWQYVGGKTGKDVKQPSFMKKAEMFTTGAALGTMNYTASLLSSAEAAFREDGKAKTIPSIYKNLKGMQQEYKSEYPESWASGTGELAGDIATTAVPLSKGLNVLGKFSKWAGATKLGSKASSGVKSLGEYGVKTGGGVALMSGMEGLRMNENNPEQLFNTEAAAAFATNPIAWGATAGGTMLANKLAASRELGKLKEAFPKGMARHTDPKKGAMSRWAFDAPAHLFQRGKLYDLFDDLADDTATYVTKLVNKGMKKYKPLDYDEYVRDATKALQKTMIHINNTNNKMFKKLPKDLKIQQADDVFNITKKALNDIQSSKIDELAPFRASIKKLIPIPKQLIKSKIANRKFIENLQKQFGQQSGKSGSQKLTFDQAREIYSYLGNVRAKANQSKYGKPGYDLATRLKGYSDEIDTLIRSNLDDTALRDYTAAMEFYKNKMNLVKNAPKLLDVIEHNKAGNDIIRSLAGEGEAISKDILPKLGGFGAEKFRLTDKVFGVKMADALKKATGVNGMEVGNFYKSINNSRYLKRMIDPERMQALKGLDNYLRAIEKSKGTGFWRQGAAISVGLGATGAGAMFGPAAAAGILVSYSAVVFAVNRSLMRTLLNAMTKKLPEKTLEHVMKVIERNFAKAGFYFSERGTLEKEKPYE